MRLFCRRTLNFRLYNHHRRHGSADGENIYNFISLSFDSNTDHNWQILSVRALPRMTFAVNRLSSESVRRVLRSFRNLRLSIHCIAGQSTICVGNVYTIQWNRPLSVDCGRSHSPNCRSVAIRHEVILAPVLPCASVPRPLPKVPSSTNDSLSLHPRDYRNRKRRLRSPLDLSIFLGSPLS